MICDEFDDELVERDENVAIVAPHHILQFQRLKHREHRFEIEQLDVLVLLDEEVDDDGIDEVELVGNDEVDEVDMYILPLLVQVLLVDIVIVLTISQLMHILVVDAVLSQMQVEVQKLDIQDVDV